VVKEAAVAGAGGQGELAGLMKKIQRTQQIL